MSCKLTIEQICTMTESPLFDRKSARIDAKTLAIHLIAFANADDGVVAVGVGGDGTITGNREFRYKTLYVVIQIFCDKIPVGGLLN